MRNERKGPEFRVDYVMKEVQWLYWRWAQTWTGTFHSVSHLGLIACSWILGRVDFWVMHFWSSDGKSPMSLSVSQWSSWWLMWPHHGFGYHLKIFDIDRREGKKTESGRKWDAAKTWEWEGREPITWYALVLEGRAAFLDFSCDSVCLQRPQNLHF